MKRIIIAVALALSFAAVSASGCPGVCMYAGQRYSEGATQPGNEHSLCLCVAGECSWT